MKKICPKCDYNNIEIKSMGDCEMCGVHSTWFCSKCHMYFEEPKIIPSLVLIDGDDLYKK